MGRYPPHLLTFKGYRPSIFIVKICAVKKNWVHRQSMGQRVKIKKKYHNQNTKVEIN